MAKLGIFKSGWGSLIGFAIGMAAGAATVYFTHELNGGPVNWGNDWGPVIASAIVLVPALLGSWIGGLVKKD